MKIYLAFLTSLLLATTSVAQTNTSTNTVYGYNSGQAINTTSAIRNVYLGANAGQFSSSTDNTFVGHLAGSASSNSGYSNTFIGSRAGLNNTSGYINVFVGGLAGMSNTTGFANVYVGPTAGANNSTGNYNMFLGNSTGANVVSGDGNVFIGDGAGYGSTTGGNNTYIGRWAGFSGNAGGSYNTFIGVGSGTPNGTGNLTNASAIGNGALVTASNSMVLGGMGANAVNVGIGTTSPSSKLHIKGGGLTLGSNAMETNTDGFVSIGDMNTSSSPTPQDWSAKTSLLLNAQDYSTIGFHDAGYRVDFIRVGNRIIQLGYDGGWGLLILVYLMGFGPRMGMWESEVHLPYQGFMLLEVVLCLELMLVPKIRMVI